MNQSYNTLTYLINHVYYSTKQEVSRFEYTILFILYRAIYVYWQQLTGVIFQRGRQQAPDPLHAGAGRQVPLLRGRLRQPGARRQAAGLGQVHELRPDLRRPGLRHLQQGRR